MAAYLLKRKYQNYEQEYALVNQMDVFNWRKEDTKPKNFDLGKYQFADTREPLFSHENVNKNVKKLKISPRWVKLFELVDSEKFDGKSGIFFGDTGAGKHMIKDENGINGENQYYL